MGTHLIVRITKLQVEPCMPMGTLIFSKADCKGKLQLKAAPELTVTLFA